MHETPLLSIHITLKNHAHVIGRLLDSIKQQTFHHYEILIIDDGCQDDSLSIIHHYNDPRIKVIRSSFVEKPMTFGEGFSSARAIQKTRCDYIMQIRPYDALPPDINIIQRHIDFMETYKHVTMLCGAYLQISLTGEKKPLYFSGKDYEIILSSPYSWFGAIIRRNFFDYCGALPNVSSTALTDYEFLARCIFQYRQRYPFYVDVLEDIMLHTYECEDPYQENGFIQESRNYIFHDEYVPIYMIMLVRMGLRPLPIEVRAHQALRFHKAIDVFFQGDVTASVQWAEKLIQQNQITEFFYPKKFNDFIIHQLALLHHYKNHHTMKIFEKSYHITTK